MELTLTTPALLFPAIAILMLGYINRYISAANVIRTFKKDYDAGYVHTDIVVQIKILRTRVELLRIMLSVAITALMCACVSMFLIFARYQIAGKIVFGASLLGMIVSMILSLFETSLSNKSLHIEMSHILGQEAKK